MAKVTNVDDLYGGDDRCCGCGADRAEPHIFSCVFVPGCITRYQGSNVRCGDSHCPVHGTIPMVGGEMLGEAALQLLASSTSSRYIKTAKQFASDFIEKSINLHACFDQIESRVAVLLARVNNSPERVEAEFEAAVLLCVLFWGAEARERLIEKATESGSSWIRALAIGLRVGKKGEELRDLSSHKTGDPPTTNETVAVAHCANCDTALQRQYGGIRTPAGRFVAPAEGFLVHPEAKAETVSGAATVCPASGHIMGPYGYRLRHPERHAKSADLPSTRQASTFSVARDVTLVWDGIRCMPGSHLERLCVLLTEHDIQSVDALRRHLGHAAKYRSGEPQQKDPCSHCKQAEERYRKSYNDLIETSQRLLKKGSDCRDLERQLRALKRSYQELLGQRSRKLDPPAAKQRGAQVTVDNSFWQDGDD